MNYVIIDAEGMNLGNEVMADEETLEVFATSVSEAIEKVFGKTKKLHIEKLGKASGVWNVRDDDKEAYGLSVIVVERK